MSYRAPPCRVESLRPLGDLVAHVETYLTLEGEVDLLRAPYDVYEVAEAVKGARREAQAQRREVEDKRETQRGLLAKYQGAAQGAKKT